MHQAPCAKPRAPSHGPRAKSPTRPPWSGAGVGAGSSAPSTHDLKRSVFLGNLPFNVQEEALRQQLSRCGEIENVRLVRDAATQHGKAAREAVKPFAIYITLLQLTQMVVGIAVTVRAVVVQSGGGECHVNKTNSILGLLMYLSYFLLFLKLFIDSYVVKGGKKVQ